MSNNQEKSDIELMAEAYWQLKSIKQHHSLLIYMDEIYSWGFKLSGNEKIKEEFIRKYDTERKNSTAEIIFRYTNDLKKAAEELKKQ